MRFTISSASSDKPEVNPPSMSASRIGDEWTVEINSLEDVLALIAETKSALIVSSESITIYDDYVE